MTAASTPFHNTLMPATYMAWSSGATCENWNPCAGIQNERFARINPGRRCQSVSRINEMLHPSTAPVKRKKLGQYTSGMATSWFAASGAKIDPTASNGAVRDIETAATMDGSS